MKTCIQILLLLIISISANAQKGYLDSLKQKLKIAFTDSVRYDIQNKIITYYIEDKRDSALYYAEEALLLAKRYNKKLDEASSLDIKGYILMHLGKLSESYRCFLVAQEIAKNPENENKTWNKATGFTPRKVRLTVLENIHHDFGHLMGSIGKIDQQIAQYKETKKIAEEIGDTVLLGFVNMNLGNVYFNLGKLDSALTLEENAARIFIQNRDERYLSNVYNLTGKLYLKKDNKSLAIQYFFKAIQSAIEQNNISNLSESYFQLGDFYLYKEVNKDSSLYYTKKRLSILQSMGSKNLGNAYSSLSESYEQNNQIDSAYKYKSLALTYIDSTSKARIESLTKVQNMGFDEQLKLEKLEKEKADTKNKITTYAMLGALAVFLSIGLILYRNNRQKQKTNRVLESTLANLKSTQTQLVQQEKLASLGALTAGIAHEIKNPLNFVNNFSELSTELVDEFIKATDETERQEIGADLKINLQKINEHGKRADSIVKNMLQHSRSGSGEKQPTDINQLCEEYFNLAFHGKRANDSNFNCEMVKNLDKTLPQVNCVVQDISRVILNLINNAFDAVREREIEGKTPNYKPIVTLITKQINNTISISISDNGKGIPQHIQEKIFEPFFTTKPAGQGTGLGLSLSYDIVKAHGGELIIETKSLSANSDLNGTEFKIVLPL
jgi:signal transduction histidine kinase/uncharacterized protein (DUF2164 family)